MASPIPPDCHYFERNGVPYMQKKDKTGAVSSLCCAYDPPRETGVSRRLPCSREISYDEFQRLTQSFLGARKPRQKKKRFLLLQRLGKMLARDIDQRVPTAPPRSDD